MSVHKKRKRKTVAPNSRWLHLRVSKAEHRTVKNESKRVFGKNKVSKYLRMKVFS